MCVFISRRLFPKSGAKFALQTLPMHQNASSPRSSWTSRLGFILAAAGSAVGLGAIWKFPYMAGTNGGSIFLLPYIFFTLTIGLALLIGEMCMGRHARGGAGTAFRKLGGRAWGWAGLLSVLTGALVLAFYSVVGGWTVHYLVEACLGRGVAEDPSTMRSAFGAFAADPVSSIGCHAAFLTATAAVVLCGVEKGIERVSKILMPLLFILMLVLIVRGLSLPGAFEGLRFLFKPDPSAFTGEALLNAMGFAFFSLSVGSGSMMNYGSYLGEEVKIGSSTTWIVLLAILASILGGLMIMPAVFAFGLSPDAGPGLTFATMPAVFAKLPFGHLFAVAFYACLFVAAITSSISILEMSTQYFVDEHGVSKRTAVVGVSTVLGLLGILSALSFGPLADVKIFGRTFFDLFDGFTSNIGMPIGCLSIALVAGGVAWSATRGELAKSGGWTQGALKAFRFVLLVLGPIVILAVAGKALGLY